MRFPALRSSLRLQLVAIGAISVMGTAGVITAASVMQARGLAAQAEEDVITLNEQSMQQTTLNARQLITTQVDTVTERIAGDLTVAEAYLGTFGEISVGEDVPWEATNQFNSETVSVDLPELFVGGVPLGSARTFADESLVVDSTTSLLNVATTVFQRMNGEGDMLRVATTVENANGERAVGTYIPATNPDGQANAVVSALLSGEPFYGNAVVVGVPFVTAYTPLFEGTEVVGALFVGVPQAEVDQPLREALGMIEVGSNGFVTVMGPDGTWVVPPPTIEPGSPIDETLVQQMRDTAGSLESEWSTAKLRLPEAAGGATVEITSYDPWGWTLGAWGLDSDLQVVPDNLNEGISTLTLTLVILGLSVAAVAVVLVALVSGRVVARVKRLTDTLGRVANHDLSVEVQPEGRDEIGQMGSALRDTVVSMREAVASLRGGADSVQSTADSLNGSSTGMQGMAAETAGHAETTAGTASTMNSEVQSVTVAMSQMRSSIESVARDVQAASSETRTAVGSTSEAGTISQRLADSSSRIAEVLKAITAIANQTNLLALNATIEAARAGEAGKGFAVVASEVWDLAQQTATAIDTIRPVLEEVTADSVEVQEAFERVLHSINQVDEHQASISAVIEEQTATTTEIERNLLVAANGATEISGAAQELSQSAQDAQRSATEVGGVVHELTSIATDLKRRVDQFTLS